MNNKKTESQEELLKEALVPVEEQPYEVPVNWSWVKLGLLVKILRGVSYKKHEVELVPTSNSCLVVRGGNVQKGKIINQDDNVYVDLSLVKDVQLLQKGDVVIVSSTGSSKIIGKPAIVKENVERVSFGAFLTTLRPNNHINSNFFGQYFLSAMYRNTIASEAKGSNINNIKQTHLSNLMFPLPPLREQKRIADKVERLLGKINEAKEVIESIPVNTLELRQAILNKAFQGELTKKWRQDNLDSSGTSSGNAESRHQPIHTCKIPKEWNWILSKDVFSFVTSGSRGWAKYYSDSGPLFIRIGNLNKNSINIDLTSEQRVSPPNGAEGTRTKVQHNDILVSITGEVGMIGLVPANFPEAYINQHVALARPISGVNPEYIAWFFVSREGGYKQFIKRQRGATKAGLGLEDIRNIWIPLPSLDEQKEIVRTINSLFSILDFTDVIRNNANELINILPQSILSKAFRGDLGTNNINEKVEL
ncbi:restriction endonuclease subunit S [Paenibacillus amylolyticus]|uniref:restriction endonuclease subunit S n=1 Tax=Paenibacillus amylolyticus TaxID=1451 RepID=UPI00201DCBBF|nr:restriction endonuclease subunit S [Paenibacillus amylolyticus]MCL6659783.1 restriction endonuclease subunit S [Paenibacillus amylolyticus]